ncbi:cell division protein FtsK [Candidatus Epulonipiscium fishelsonii]|uniref:Cell division protein FtsK n=1 Tax=Candidatus Epulonipiscium fishelsonii TaxID=77094 RepID=A0ACC8XE25_9FIRM|nr:cell division protein FtsK [Epulopiscium sp. SCG-B05WGA-EpuloA1]ONI41226.1 cell division protein FtsK [Epulopiscium sp. SCG-B11WGA-EpuloA1]
MKKKKKQLKKKDIILKREYIGIIFSILGLLTIISVFTNQGGLIGNSIKELFVGMFGVGGYIIPFYIVVSGIIYMRTGLKEVIHICLKTVPPLCITILAAHVITYGNEHTLGLLSLIYWRQASYYNGGYFGGIFSELLLTLFGIYGTYCILGVAMIGWLLWAMDFPIASWLKKYISAQPAKKSSKAVKKSPLKKELFRQQEQIVKPEIEIADYQEQPSVNKAEPVKTPISASAKKNNLPKTEKKVEKDIEISVEFKSDLAIKPNYKFPNVNLLQSKTVRGVKTENKELLEHSKKLEETLASFGVEAKVLKISKGPTVTRYEVQPKQGIKVSKIVNLADDISLNLAAAGIRIEAPIPGKSAVGIEVPNAESEIVYLKDVIDNDNFIAFPSDLAFALGKDIAGKPVIADISKMPHMLIAGSTGSGKSVCINTLITSIIYKSTPDEVKLILIDPKVVELSVYNGIPHLLIPVVTDPKKAAGALHWAVNEMTKRYSAFAENSVRDITGYNKKIKDDSLKMPKIVIVIDELADLMMTGAKEVEELICRLAQMARAAGIHLVIATQRPSVDVITGLIKANIPSRLAFAVSSGVDSRTILDMNGAEKLMGKGDMLFNPIGAAKPLRVQGAFISDDEIENIVNAIKLKRQPDYKKEIMDTLVTEKPSVKINSSEEDELFLVAKNLAKTTNNLTIAMLQRNFKIGFNRASKLMAALETNGIVEKGTKKLQKQER